MSYFDLVLLSAILFGKIIFYSLLKKQQALFWLRYKFHVLV